MRKQLCGPNEMYLVSADAVAEAKKVIKSLVKTGTESGKYMASGGNAILTILGLDEEEEEIYVDTE